MTNGFNWQSSWLGNFYLPSDSPLLGEGDVTADQVGLYWFTTQTSQAPQGTSQVDIGYHYRATDSYGNPLDDNGDGDSWSPPSITTQPASQSVAQGSPVTFSVAAAGRAPLTYQWTCNGTNIPGATSSSFTISSVQTTDAATYAVVVANGAGSLGSSGATLAVGVPPSITSQPASQTVDVGMAASFSVTATGTGTLTYQWYLNGNGIWDATSSTYAIAWAQMADAGTYTVIVSSAFGSATNSGATLTVNPPIQFAISLTNLYVNPANVPLSLDIQAGTPYYYAVMVDSTSFSSASWTDYTSSNITAPLGSTQGWHTVWVGLCDLLGGVPTWYPVRINLNWTQPRLVVTNPAVSTVSAPVMQLLGYSAEALSSISYGLSNAVGVVTNQQALVTGQYYDLGLGQFTTNYFACLDIPLTNGVNTITLQAADLAGNVTVANYNYTLDYSGVTAQTVQIAWPADGSLVSGTNFTCRGWISDPTATVATSAVDGNGNTWDYTGVVDRDGNFWLENIPLNAGTNVFSISVTDVVGSNTVTNISVVQSALTLTMNDMSLDPQLWQPTIYLSGTISDSSSTVWVNGVQGTNYGSTWDANNVPVPPGPNASFDMAAYAPGQTQPGGVISQNPAKPARVYVANYGLTNTYNLTNWSAEFDNYWLWYVMTTKDTNVVNWTDGAGGSGNKPTLR